ncbi:PLP-dependent aminotransferase family protein [Labedaea rhizosphaerae]|uniref:GntR family transcriptional regulator/MocR family aminotransferase n=1 Tax=Labedaea rhizosphaerae TaxID=598644 RepID=A0A4R6SMT6_LABRH|nr:PLP-dependent aminotransferase family protein [Labedaea rhizosphaerae]TDQ04483.1 GntR family transcriptional regulator/MocR family aminotransferase [Labedaea rhizosphaerae]
MPESWSSVDLHLDDVAGGRGRALAESIRTAIRSGRLRAGEPMPSSRALAADVGVARGTVTAVYDQLAIEGYLQVTPRGVTRVGGPFLARQPDVSSTKQLTEPPLIDLRPGRPDLTLFPRSAWVAATRSVLRAAPASALDYGHPAGPPTLRNALAAYLGRTRGVVTDPDRLVICNGYGQALFLLATLIREQGGTALGLENPSLPQFARTIRRAGLTPCPIAADADGPVIDGLDAAGLAVTPGQQAILGTATHPKRRAALAALAGDLLVIEDDYNGEFRYDRHPAGALQALNPDHIVYVGTASKSLAPGLRLAWLALPPSLVEPVTAIKADVDRHTATVDCLVLAELIEKGGYDRQIRRARTHYRRRRDRLLAALAGTDAQPWPNSVAAGMHVMLRVPPGRDEDEVLATATRNGLRLLGLHSYAWAEADLDPGIAVGYAAPPEHAFATALDALVRTFTTPGRGPSRRAGSGTSPSTRPAPSPGRSRA